MTALILGLLAIALVLFALGWKPSPVDLSALWTGIFSGVKYLITAPVNNFGMLLKRFAFVVALILLLGAAFGGPSASGPDGSYASLQDSIKAYQSAHGLNPDGIWGKQTNTDYVKGL